MANRINNRRYNKLLSYRNNYYVYGSQMQNGPYRFNGFNGIYPTPAIVDGMGGVQNPSQGYDPTITQPSATGGGLFGNLGTSIVSPTVASYLPGIGATYKNPQVTPIKTKGLFGNLGATIVDGFK